MTRSRLLRTTILAFAGAAALGASAQAGGEPKNQWPFTRPATVRTVEVAAQPHARQPVIQGEPKNEPPFTRPATVVVANDTAGFDWTDGGIGAAAGLGIGIAGIGALLVARKAPQPA